MSNMLTLPLIPNPAGVEAVSAGQQYLQYVCERENLQVKDYGIGFALYRVIPADKVLYMHTVFVVPTARNSGAGPFIAADLEKMAQQEGLKGVCTTISPNGMGSTLSLNIVLNLGYKLHSSEKDLIWLYKEFSGVQNG